MTYDERLDFLYKWLKAKAKEDTYNGLIGDKAKSYLDMIVNVSMFTSRNKSINKDNWGRIRSLLIVTASKNRAKLQRSVNPVRHAELQLHANVLMEIVAKMNELEGNVPLVVINSNQVTQMVLN